MTAKAPRDRGAFAVADARRKRFVKVVGARVSREVAGYPPSVIGWFAALLIVVLGIPVVLVVRDVASLRRALRAEDGRRASDVVAALHERAVERAADEQGRAARESPAA